MADLRVVVRAMRAVRPSDRADLCDRILRRADLADRYSRRLGKAHPKWGNGTLLAVTNGLRLADEICLVDGEMLELMALLLSRLSDF